MPLPPPPLRPPPGVTRPRPPPPPSADELEKTTLHVSSPPVEDEQATRIREPEPPGKPVRDSVEFDVDWDDDDDSDDGTGTEASKLDARSQTRLSRQDVVGADALDKGTVVGRYVIVERIGTGGMGSVYAAYDPELDRKVAVKVLHATTGSKKTQEAARGRLVREAQALAKLSHPAVVTVHDVGVFREQVFMAMEFVEGRTLKDWMKAQSPSWRRVLEVFKAAGQGLAAAHAAGLIHRDFKPTNVILSEAGRVRILDFGLARRTEYRSGSEGADDGTGGEASQSSSSKSPWADMIARGELTLTGSMSSLDMQLTQAGAVMGSPAYMAPEQHMSQPTDPRTDVFSFCATMYEALYGTRPYVTEDPRMMIYAIMEGRMHKPPRDSGVPAWLRKVLLRGLAADPNDRYASMNELLADLSRDPGRRLRNIALALGGLIAVGGIGTAIALPYVGTPAADESASAAVEQLVQEAHEAAAKAHYVYPPADDPDHPTALRTIQQLEALEGDAEKLARQRAEELRAEFAATLVGIGDRYWEQEGGKAFAIDYYAQALVFDDSVERARERAALTVGQLAALRQRASQADFSEGELVAAESLAVLAEPDEQARKEKLESMLAEADQGKRSITAQAQLEQLAGGEKDRANKKAKPKASAAPEVPEVDFSVDAQEAEPSTDTKSRRDPEAARELATEAEAALRATRWDEAERLFHKALSLDRRCSPALIGLSDLHFERSEYNKALTYAERAVASSPKNAGYRIKLGDVYYKTLRYPEAKEAYEAAQQLGSTSAEGRLAKIENKLGG